MKLSTRSTYGLRALVELGLAADTGRGAISAASIADRQDLSVAYLEQLLHRLKVHGLLASIRGPKGGYLLAKEPRAITVAQVVQILDGPSIVTHHSTTKSGHADAQQVTHAVFRCVHERLLRSLDQVTLEDLCADVRDHAQEPIEHRYVFHI